MGVAPFVGNIPAGCVASILLDEICLYNSAWVCCYPAILPYALRLVITRVLPSCIGEKKGGQNEQGGGHEPSQTFVLLPFGLLFCSYHLAFHRRTCGAITFSSTWDLLVLVHPGEASSEVGLTVALQGLLGAIAKNIFLFLYSSTHYLPC